ncbi:hypothetical protein PHYBLDRAFT_166744 [Phycomyces blakesleeanus NRRL 1555(-)]|uniref:Uncharacterized protein n=1 Tax=Phycomyces blakesleeanus (strain ATCC 8743b / DSM 1359 / FGSC 10004 / NBRC 33097 / NRRL 1555) TaxID=763407 RepID=A0A167NAL1_PHYB8|nr:hypothetical protein PHYBLDRAFT_166744 [Phycomyces blakesleeanus NRRL 1555(-)]OAD75504.1 hypothetical protein PHYBLDRAFT_166744 [Phycomyces blakesleeanus NRRL 1555(-)]|eukprot:XP_018293544.1 hypothetical protein PHYBLDRAFT_166744 [Phycomyces blakesleeanus NRRL 1555(-)]
MHVLLELRKQSLIHICDAFKKEHDKDNVDEQVLKEFNKKRRRDREELNNMCMHVQRKLVNQKMKILQLTFYNIFFCIYNSSFKHIQATPTRKKINQHREKTIWWRITYPSLGDTPHIDDIGRVVKESMFKEHYHITLSTFETLVNILSGTEPYRRCDESELAWPVWKQVAVVLWRFSNTHFGYRMAKDKFGCSHGGYNNFTDQFILAMSSIIIDNVIT